jgi:hypothetical protein
MEMQVSLNLSGGHDVDLDLTGLWQSGSSQEIHDPTVMTHTPN